MVEMGPIVHCEKQNQNSLFTNMKLFTDGELVQWPATRSSSIQLQGESAVGNPKGIILQPLKYKGSHGEGFRPQKLVLNV